MTARVSVVLSAYNGIAYISEQIASILSQEDVEVDLWIRDDGSFDGTREYLEINQHRFHFIQDDLGNLGTSGSLQVILKHLTDVNFLAFADQDDIWLPRHLMNAVSLLRSDENYLYFPRYQLTDSSGVKGRILERKSLVNLSNAVVENQVIGCGIVVTEAGFHILQTLSLSNRLYLDWQLYFIFSALHGIVQGNEVGLLYRIHSNNSVGLRKKTDYFRVEKFKNALLLANQKNIVFRNLYRQLNSRLPNDSIRFLTSYFSVMEKGILRRAMYTLSPGFKRSNLFDQIVHKLIFIFKGN